MPSLKKSWRAKEIANLLLWLTQPSSSLFPVCLQHPWSPDGSPCSFRGSQTRGKERARPENKASVWGAVGRGPQAGDSTVPGPAACSQAHQVHRVMGRRVAGMGLGGQAWPYGGRMCRAEKRQGDLLGCRQGSHS